MFSGAAEFPLESCVLAPAAPPTQPHSPPNHSPASQKARRRRNTTQGAYGAMRFVNCQPWYHQRRGWAQVRTPRNPVSRQRREAPEEQLGAPSQLRSKLRLSQGAISNENAALAGRRARFQGIELFKASFGELGPHIQQPRGRSLYYMRARFVALFAQQAQEQPKTAPAYNRWGAPLALRTPQQVLRW